MDDEQRKYTAYLLQAIRNTKINYINKMKRTKGHVWLMDVRQMDFFADIKDWNVDGIWVYQDYSKYMAVQDERLLGLFIRLTDREREIVVNRIFLEQSFTEAGRIYGLTADQAKHVYYYAIDKMRRFTDGI